MPHDIALSTEQLKAAIGIMLCERMLYSRPPLVEAKIDAQIAFYEAALALRKATQAAEAALPANE